jgi:dipeptidyl-peptidase 4
MKSFSKIFTFFLLLLAPSVAFCQNKNLSMDDVVLASKRGLVPATLEQLKFRAESNEITFVIKDKTIEKLVSVTLEDTTRRELASTIFLNQLLKKNSSPDSLKTFPTIEWKNYDSFTFMAGETYEVNLKDPSLKKILDAPVSGASNKDFNANGQALAYTVDNNLWVTTSAGNNQVTHDSIKGIVNGQLVHREEFGIHKGTFFSPSGKLLAFYRMDETMVTDYPLLKLEELPAGAEMIKYPMAGGVSHHVTIGIYNLQTNKTIFLKTGEPADQYLTNIAWSPDEKTIMVAILNRGQDHLSMNRYDAATGNLISVLFEEKENKYIQPLHPVYFNKLGNRFVWQSRRDGYNHLYLYESSGKLIKQLTKGNWEVAEFIGFDTEEKNCFYVSNEIKPINKDIYSVDINSLRRKRLSLGDGVHKATSNSKGSLLVDEFSGPGVPRKLTLMNATGKKGILLLDAPNPLQNFTPVTREIFTIKNSNGDELYCRMFKPANFDSTRTYPAIVYVYGGPMIQLITNTWNGGADLWFSYMAQRGIILFTVENRGTPMRGKEWEQSTFRRLGEIELEDQVAGTKYLMQQRYIDKSKLGIYGWSYGGFMTVSMMTRNPNLFKVAVAGGPVIDWRFYEVMYTERYMDTPNENPEGYAKSSLLNYVDKLKGKMLLIHGTSDPVVVWQQSLTYLKKAVDSNIQLDYFVYPGHEHNVTGKDRIHLLNKVSQYFFDNFR